MNAKGGSVRIPVAPSIDQPGAYSVTATASLDEGTANATTANNAPIEEEEEELREDSSFGEPQYSDEDNDIEITLTAEVTKPEDKKKKTKDDEDDTILEIIEQGEPVVATLVPSDEREEHHKNSKEASVVVTATAVKRKRWVIPAAITAVLVMIGIVIAVVLAINRS